MRLHDVIISIGYQLGSMALAVIVAIFAYEVVMRYVFLNPTRWVEESARVLQVYGVFLA